MKRKPASRRPAKTKKAHVVGVKVPAKPTRKQLAALKKAFSAEALASAGLAPRATITTQTLSKKRTT
jgi:hypothetical protein